MEKFGIYAIEQRLKVTNDIKNAGKVIIIPCSIGFQQQDKTWVNEWIDVTVFSGDCYAIAQQIGKGDQITVSGRLNLKSWKDKKSWVILCEKLSVGMNRQQDVPGPDEDVPF